MLQAAPAAPEAELPRRLQAPWKVVPGLSVNIILGVSFLRLPLFCVFVKGKPTGRQLLLLLRVGRLPIISNTLFYTKFELFHPYPPFLSV